MFCIFSLYLFLCKNSTSNCDHTQSQGIMILSRLNLNYVRMVSHVSDQQVQFLEKSVLHFFSLFKNSTSYCDNNQFPGIMISTSSNQSYIKKISHKFRFKTLNSFWEQCFALFHTIYSCVKFQPPFVTTPNPHGSWFQHV